MDLSILQKMTFCVEIRQSQTRKMLNYLQQWLNTLNPLKDLTNLSFIYFVKVFCFLTCMPYIIGGHMHDRWADLMRIYHASILQTDI